MLERTSEKAAFVWIYSLGGARVVPADEVVAQRQIRPEMLGDRSITEQFGEVLDCFQGDTNLVAPGIFTSDKALAAFMEDIAAKRGVAIRLALEREG